jgi:hypothetical protein
LTRYGNSAAQWKTVALQLILRLTGLVRRGDRTWTFLNHVALQTVSANSVRRTQDRHRIQRAAFN